MKPLRSPREIIRVADEHYIHAASTLTDDRTLVTKQGETFAVFDRRGDIHRFGAGHLGLYHRGTRYLSEHTMRIAGEHPLLLSSTVLAGSGAITVDLTNPDLTEDGEVVVPRGTIHVHREKFLYDARCFERIRISNFGSDPVSVPISFEYDADHADIFEVRGSQRPARGTSLLPRIGTDRVTLSYRGRDDVVRATAIQVAPAPAHIDAESMVFSIEVAAGAHATIEITATCRNGEAKLRPLRFADAVGRDATARREQERGFARIETSNDSFNDWLERSRSDLLLMLTDTEHGQYPYAGVPWFSTPFGRDGIITALQTLWFDPQIARGVLTFLAAEQATRVDPERDAEPGKILHELRECEMAACDEIPFGRYFGSIDATPLFVYLLGAYHRATGDDATVAELWKAAERALAWIDRYGDLEGDGFVSYAKRSERGLTQQGWKDSHDSVWHADGTIPDAPIALIEVQGYVYAAKREAARLAALLGRRARATALQAEADELRARFEQAFWLEDLGTYALALDGEGRPCRVRTSNAGHALYTGIASPERAARVAETLFDRDSFTGWGIRTVASEQSRYNPMSYHNGSVWPHDNALIALGLRRYGFADQVVRIATALFEASDGFELRRMPELFCGFSRRPHAGPTRYPVACEPQAWSAGATFMLLQALLGLEVDGPARRVRFSHPVLPSFLDEVRIADLHVGEATVEVRLRRRDDGSVDLAHRGGDVEIVQVT